MKTFKTAFPFIHTGKLPENFKLLIADKAFVYLKDSATFSAGWAPLYDEHYALDSDGCILIKYIESSRKADAGAVRRLAEERTEKISQEGRELTPELLTQLDEQAQAEALKYAPVKSFSVPLLICPAKKIIVAGGSTLARCEDALSYLRGTIESLPVIPRGMKDSVARTISIHMTSRQPHHGHMPENLNVDSFGKTIFVGEDSPLKVVVDGVQSDSEDMRGVVNGMFVRSVDMQLIRRLPTSREVLATFALQLPPAGNLHLKNFDYDDDTGAEDIGHQYMVEMKLVSTYIPQIIDGLEEFAGVKQEIPDEA